MVVKVKFEAGDVQAPSHSSIISQPLGHNFLISRVPRAWLQLKHRHASRSDQAVRFHDELESFRHLMDSQHSEINSANDWLSGLSSDIAWNQKRPIVWTIWQWQRTKNKIQCQVFASGTVGGRLHKISYVAVVHIDKLGLSRWTS